MDQARSEMDLDFLVKGMENGQKNIESPREGKQGSAIQIHSSLRERMKQLLTIALVHFNALTGLQLLFTAPSAEVLSSDHVLLLFCSTVRQVSPRGLNKQSFNHTTTIYEHGQGRLGLSQL